MNKKNVTPFEIQIRVRYGETDQMGVVYYGNFALYLEQARTEMIRSLGYTYKEIESMGIGMPVVDMHIRYMYPAKYDDLITLKTWIKEPPGRKITYCTEMYNEKGKKLNESEVTLVFLNMSTGKAIQCPEEIKQKIDPYTAAGI